MSSNKVDLIIKNVTAVLPEGKQATNVICHDGKIVAITDTLNSYTSNTVLDGTNKHLLPGVIDSQVHFREPGLEHKETISTGTKAAILGGVTSIIEMPNTTPPTTNEAALKQKLNIAAESAWSNFAFYAGASAENTHLLPDLEKLPGCAGIKVFMGSSFGSLLVDNTTVLTNILKSCQRRIAIHAEDETRLRERKHIAESSSDVYSHPEWRDVKSALNATQKVVTIAKETGAKLHLLHISSADEMDYLRQQKSLLNKQQITVETLPQYLHFHAPNCYIQRGSRVQMNPPIRERYHQYAIWDAIHDGTVDVMATDHAPHTLEEKAHIYPNSPSGMPGTQTLLPVMLNMVNQNKISLEKLVNLICEGPCRVLGIENKGNIAEGFDADLVLVDMAKVHTFDDADMASQCRWTPYHGDRVTGFPIATILAGKIVMKNGNVVGEPSGKALSFL
ncbi:dihydroorotase [Marinomonas mediterranea]|uniref:dihydroorotase n=1 Tax=Marinomonas mediterranea TaxID=119864 RepID=UPI00234AEE7A|nr:dihydroorotase [Marinomonas mediterranea]WCN10578.1 dihydroorotase [Marinomonas mediterranea]